MMSLKLSILVAIIAVVVGTPTLLCKHHSLHNPLHILHQVDHHLPKHQKKSSHNIKNCLGLIFKSLKPSPKVCDQSAIQFLQKCKKPKHINDVIKTIIDLTQGVGGIMDKHYPGLGSLGTRLVIALTRISACKYGSNRFTKRPSFCTRDFSQFGIKGEGRDVDDVCGRFKVNNAVKQVLDLINKYTNGGGIKSVKGILKIYSQICLNLAKLIDDRSCLNDKTFSKIIIQVTIAVGCLGNAYEVGLGTTISIGIIKTIHPIIIDIGFPGIQDRCDEVKNIVVETNGNGAPIKVPDDNKSKDSQSIQYDFNESYWEDEEVQETTQSTDQGIKQGLPQGTIQNTDQGNEQGTGQNTDQGTGQNTDQGTGQNNDQTSGQNNQGTGQETNQGTGQSTDQGNGQNTDQGTGDNNQGTGQNTDQGTGQDTVVDQQGTVQEVQQDTGVKDGNQESGQRCACCAPTD